MLFFIIMGILKQLSNKVNDLENRLVEAHTALNKDISAYENTNNVELNSETLNLYQTLARELENLSLTKGLLQNRRDAELDRYILGYLVGISAFYAFVKFIFDKRGEKNTAKPKDYDPSRVYDEILATKDYATVTALCNRMEDAHDYKQLQRIETQLFYSTMIPRVEVTLHTKAQ
jgi:hypothetical protein